MIGIRNRSPGTFLNRLSLRSGGAIVIICIVIEIRLTGSDMGLWGVTFERFRAYQYGGFWSGILLGWAPNYAIQPWLMFLTYGFLHGGLWHLLGNMFALLGLARALRSYIGPKAFFFLYAISQISAAAVYTLLAPTSFRPMVGASGAVFGLAGAWVMLRFLNWKTTSRTAIALGSGLAIAGLNLFAWLFAGGPSAWQAHLGGSIAGMIFGAIYFWLRFAKIRS